MKKTYETNRPFIFTAVSILIFGFTSVVFLIYDRLVEKRQRIVLRAAVQSSAVVSSLFPSNVRERLFPNQENQMSPKKSAEKRVSQFEINKSRMASFLNGEYQEPDATPSFDSSPIADTFEQTTVLFADIAGFTVRIVLFSDLDSMHPCLTRPFFHSVCFAFIIC